MKGCLPGHSLQAEIRASGPMDQSKAVRIKGGVWERSRRSHGSWGPLSSGPLWSRSWESGPAQKPGQETGYQGHGQSHCQQPKLCSLAEVVGEEDCESGRVQAGAGIRRD